MSDGPPVSDKLCPFTKKGRTTHRRQTGPKPVSYMLASKRLRRRTNSSENTRAGFSSLGQYCESATVFIASLTNFTASDCRRTYILWMARRHGSTSRLRRVHMKSTRSYPPFKPRKGSSVCRCTQSNTCAHLVPTSCLWQTSHCEVRRCLLPCDNLFPR